MPIHPFQRREMDRAIPVRPTVLGRLSRSLTSSHLPVWCWSRHSSPCRRQSHTRIGRFVPREGGIPWLDHNGNKFSKKETICLFSPVVSLVPLTCSEEKPWTSPMRDPSHFFQSEGLATCLSCWDLRWPRNQTHSPIGVKPYAKSLFADWRFFVQLGHF